MGELVVVGELAAGAGWRSMGKNAAESKQNVGASGTLLVHVTSRQRGLLLHRPGLERVFLVGF